MERNTILQQVERNLNWFVRSGVVSPEDGYWGVAERIVITEGNEAAKTIREQFPTQTPHGNWVMIEPRRADCNFETALYFLAAGQVLENGVFSAIGENLVDYLYCRSGLLIRRKITVPAGWWNWSHANLDCGRAFWIDDNGKVGMLQRQIAKLAPHLAKRYQMEEWCICLADAVCDFFERSIAKGIFSDPAKEISGDLSLPHWGGTATYALSAAYGLQQKERYRQNMRCFHAYFAEHLESFNGSELAYGVLSSAYAARGFEDKFCLELAGYAADRLIEKMDPVTGNIPAEHYEAPQGNGLVDLIYTVNWVLPALQCIAELDPSPRREEAYRKVLQLITSIQDHSGDIVFDGCWRGMYDLKAGKWGGGDRFEGGANSIYSGWTNAPIGLSLVLAAEGRSLLSLL